MTDNRSYKGIVREGEHTGRKLGFPTANIFFEDPTITGIYAAEAVLNGHTYKAGVYANQRRKILEAHLLDFSGDLYGQELTITLFEKIRDDIAFETFTNVERLSAKIAEDIVNVRKYFKNP